MPKTKVNTPDGGTITVDHPEGASQDDILAFAQSQFQAAPTASEPTAEPLSPLVPQAGLPEAALSMLTGALSQPVAGLAGIGAGIIPGGRTGAEAVEGVSSALTFQPRTRAGQSLLGAISKPFEAIEQAADTVGEVTGDPEDVLGATAVKTALLGAPAVLGLRGVRRTPKPLTNRQQIAAKAQESGYVVDPAATNTGAVAGIVEGAGGKLKTQQVASVRNQKVTTTLANRARGPADDALITREGLSAIRKVAADDYEALRSVGQIATDQKFRADISVATSRIRGAQKDFPGLAQKSKKVLDVADDINRSQFDSGSAIDAMRLIRDQADEAFRKGQNSQGSAFRKLSDALEGAIERDLVRKNAGPVLERFRASRERIAKTHSVENALEGSEVSASKLASQLKRGKPLTAELKQIAEFADQFPKVTRTMREAVPQFSPLDIWTSLTSVGAGVATGNPALLAPAAFSFARPAIRSGALGKAGQSLATRPGLSPPRGITEAIISAELANQQ